MSQSNNEHSPFDKNLRSLLDAFAMFEREAGFVFDRFGFDTDAVTRGIDLVGMLSVEAVRPLAAALGIADTAAVEALARDVRSLLQGEAKLRREQAASASRLDDLLVALEALGTATAGLADLQGRTQDRLDALADRATAIESTNDQRQKLFEDVSRLRTRIDELESRLAAEMGIFSPVDEGPRGDDEVAVPTGVRPAGARRQVPRTVRAGSGSHKILEGLPTLETKIRPA